MLRVAEGNNFYEVHNKEIYYLKILEEGLWQKVFPVICKSFNALEGKKSIFNEAILCLEYLTVLASCDEKFKYEKKSTIDTLL